jgi:hypothetical protein
VQPEIESRGQFIAGESTTIQALMCLAHGMRRRPGARGGYRGLVFFDSIDSLKRLLDDYIDAEQGNRLARLRTRRYPKDPVNNQPRDRCCGKPEQCDLFRQGECWFFAAAAPEGDPPSPNDPYQVAAAPGGSPGRYRPGRPLRVVPRPVYSGSSGRVERTIADSDLVFSTSSLEVGFDDPDMILVYQHYAPVNLASFIQRKGRGGREGSDRPVTGVTLSIYSPRDAWYFRHPDEMLRADGFEVPLNADNHFVRRGQALAALLDGIARGCCRRGEPMPKPSEDNLAAMRRLLAELAEDVDALVRVALGDTVYAGLKVRDVADLWERSWGEREPLLTARSWRDLLPWVPRLLFDAINLPPLSIRYAPEGNDSGESKQDIGLVFGECCPGNATRRFGRRQVHWLPPSPQSSAPMLPEGGYAGCRQERLLSDEERKRAGNTEEGFDRFLRQQLPDEVSARLPPGQPIHHELCRPVQIELRTLGVLNGNWKPAWFWDPAARRLVEGDPDNPPAGTVGVHHKSRAGLLGFPLLRTTQGLRRSKPIRGLERMAQDVGAFTGGPHTKAETGLRVARAYWGVEVRLVLDDRERTEEVWSVAFTDHTQEQPKLHGYHIDTEGVQLTPDAGELNAFLGAEEAAIAADGKRGRWLRGQFFRYLLTAHFAGAGLSSYSAGPIADLLVAASSD